MEPRVLGNEATLDNTIMVDQKWKSQLSCCLSPPEPVSRDKD